MSSSVRKIVLASTSRYRRELLERLGFPFEAVAPDYGEPPLDLPHDEWVSHHAVEKARSLATRFPDALIIGSDQLVSFENEVLGKPGDVERAVAQLMCLSGRTHRLLTAVAVLDTRDGRIETALDVHRMRMRPFDRQTAEQVVARDNPVDCAGAYKLESLGIALFASIEGEDDTAVVGLPLLKLLDLLERFEVTPFT